MDRGRRLKRGRTQPAMRRVVLGGVLAGVTLASWSPADAQIVGEIFRMVNPSVVVIRARGRDVAGVRPVEFTETGSGVLISGDGKILTAAHVVHTMNEINVEFLGGETIKARVVASELGADLSMLELVQVPAGARVAMLADSDSVEIGDQVIVIGAPYGLRHAMTVGSINARWAPNTIYRVMPLAEFFQTDAVINTGNSGGPMFNMAGEVIGIVSHNISKSGGSEGLGFGVTVNAAKHLLWERPAQARSSAFWIAQVSAYSSKGLRR